MEGGGKYQQRIFNMFRRSRTKTDKEGREGNGLEFGRIRRNINLWTMFEHSITACFLFAANKYWIIVSLGRRMQSANYKINIVFFWQSLFQCPSSASLNGRRIKFHDRIGICSLGCQISDVGISVVDMALLSPQLAIVSGCYPFWPSFKWIIPVGMPKDKTTNSEYMLLIPDENCVIVWMIMFLQEAIVKFQTFAPSLATDDSIPGVCWERTDDTGAFTVSNIV